MAAVPPAIESDPAPAARPAASTSAFRAYGVRFGLRVDDSSLFPAFVERLPPGARPCRRPGKESFICAVARSGVPAVPGLDVWRVSVGDAAPRPAYSEAEALDVAEGLIRFEVARRTPHWTFVHAGVVGWDGRAILIPGSSYSGKSTLVRALVRAGATYYSDEYAVLDRRGRVYPFAQPLMSREPSGIRQRVSVGELGGGAGARGLRVGMVVPTRFSPGTMWNPVRLSPGEAVLALLGHTVQAQQAPARVLRVLARVAEGAQALEGPRGEADDTAALLLKAAAGPAGVRGIA